MKISKIYIIIVYLIKKSIEDLCSSKDTTNCLKPIEIDSVDTSVSFNVPIFQGRCCLDESNNCDYVSTPSLGKIINNNYKCGTNMESCLSHVMKNSLNKEECTTFSIEMPYRCCYIKYKTEGRCFPIDTSRNKNIYSTKYHIKAKLGYFDGEDIHIDCFQFFLKFNFFIFFLGLELIF